MKIVLQFQKYISNIWQKTKSKFFNINSFVSLLNVILIISIVVSSGYALATFVDTLYRALAAGVTLLLSVSIYILNFNLSIIDSIKKEHRLPAILPSVILLFIFGFSAFLTMFANSDIDNLLGYGVYGCIVLAAFFVVRSYKFDAFISKYKKIIFYLSLTALFFLAINKISGISFGIGKFDNGRGSIYDNYFFIFFQNIYLDRLQSVFWEPGVYSSFLLIALYYEIVKETKIKLYRVLVLLISLLLTKSTFAYISLLLILIVFMNRTVKKNNIKIILLVTSFISFIVVLVFFDPIIEFLANLMPTIFSKIAESNQSLTTRLLSPQINFQIFLRSPFFGSGFKGADTLYGTIISELGYSSLVEAQTSTSLYLLAVFGVSGSFYSLAVIFGILWQKKLDVIEKISLVLLFLIIINKEPHASILVTWVFIFYFIRNGFDEMVISKKYLAFNGSKKSLFLMMKGNGPSQLLFKNIVFTILLKGSAIFIGFFSIRVLLNYFSDETSYGVWLVLLSVLSWIMTFDLGLGNGMKNKLIESFASRNEARSKKIISVSYISSSVISIFTLLCGGILVFVLDLNSIFGVTVLEVSPITLKIATFITLFGISLEFTLKNIVYIFHAQQKQRYANAFPLISSLSLLLFAFFFKFGSTSEQLIYLSIAYALFHNITYLLVTIIVFTKPLKTIRPSLKFMDFSVVKEVMTLSITFFIIQILLLILNTTDQILITNFYDPSAVVEYTKYMKIFNVISSVFTIICIAFWASIKKAYVDGDIKWIKKMQNKFFVIAIAFSLVSLLIVFAFQVFVDVWLGKSSINVNYMYALICCVYSVESFFIAIFSAVSNGIQTLKTQLVFYAAGVIIKFVLSFSVIHFFKNIDWIFIILVNILSTLPLLVALPIANERKMRLTQTSYISGSSNNEKK